MKKQLLTTLLAFTSFFTAAKPSNAELLAHLKTVKKDIELLRLDAMERSIDEYNLFGKKQYFFLLNMIQDIDQQLGHSLKKKIFGDLNVTVNLLCNEMKTIMDVEDDLATKYDKLVATNFSYTTENDEKEAMLIQSITIKHYEQYRRNNPNDDLTINCLTNLSKQDKLVPFLAYSGIERLYKLSKKIDAKIAELEHA